MQQDPNRKPDGGGYDVSDDELAVLRCMAAAYVPAIEWVGRELKCPFQTGIWLEQIGKDDLEKIAAGERFATDPKSVTEVWKRWDNVPGSDKRTVTDTIGGRRIDGWINPVREAMPEADTELWPLDKAGKPKDPWSEETRIVLRRQSDDQLFTWITRYGERKAIGEAVDLFAREFQQHPPGTVPTFTLDSILRGKSFQPLLVPTGDWVVFGEGAALPANPARLKRAHEELARVREKYEPKVIPLASAKKGKAPSKRSQDMDDEIAF